ncbi:MAG: hypothetical protein WBP03_05795 [Candidatus Saccharimonadales bacterium]|jgi:hypothetical protein
MNQRFELSPSRPDFTIATTYVGNNHGAADLPALVAPNFTNPTAVVENVYAHPGLHPGSRDRTSQGRMEDYLGDRIIPTGPREYEMSGLIPDGYVDVNTRVPDGWRITPRRALAATMLSFLALTGLGNAEAIGHDTATAVQDLGDEIRQAAFYLRYGSETPDKVVMVPGGETTLEFSQELPAKTNNTVENADPDEATIRKFAEKIESVMEAAESENDSSTVVIVGEPEIRSTGDASDEWGGDRSIGEYDPKNLQLADKRANNAVDATIEALAENGIPSRKGTVGVEENILYPNKKTALEGAAKKAGFTGENPITDAIRAVDHGQTTPKSLNKKVRDWVTSKRGTKLTAKIQIERLDMEADTPTFVEGRHAPEDPDRDYDMIMPFLLPVLPIRRFRRVLDRVPAFQELVLRGRGRVEWLRLYPDALTENEELKRHAVFYTRKYNHLLRDDRISTVDRMDYVAHDGAERSLRTLYVDSEPSEYFQQKMREVAAVFSAAQEGTIADNTPFIAVFPSDSAGISHGDPKKIALGIDTQQPEEVLGFNMPLLGLIELHAPVNGTREEIDSFFGAVWTQAHELTHSMDIKPEPARLIRFADGTYGTVNPWNDSFENVDGALANLPAQRPQEIEFDIIRDVVDRDGNHRRVTERVSERDSRLSEAVSVQIVGHKPTTYGSTDSLEHAAETGAGATTSTDIPFAEAGVQVPAHSGFNFADGYKPAEESLQVFADNSGLNPNRFRGIDLSRVTFTKTTVQDDPLLHDIAERARRTRVPRERDMVHIGAWVFDSQSNR